MSGLGSGERSRPSGAGSVPKVVAPWGAGGFGTGRCGRVAAPAERRVCRWGGIVEASHVDEVPQVFSAADAGLREKLSDLEQEALWGVVVTDGELNGTVQAVAGDWKEVSGG